MPNVQSSVGNCRMGEQLSSLLIMLLLLVAANAADYGETGDFAQYDAAASEAMASNDEFYDAALLQQEVSETEQRNNMRLEDELARTETVMKDVRNISNNKIHRDYSSHMERSEEHIAEDESAHVAPSEEYDEVLTTSTPKRFMPQVGATASAVNMLTATVPEYVRKAKAGGSFAPTTGTGGRSSSGEERMDSNMSLSDYVEDEAVPNTVNHNTQQQNATDEDDEIVPLAMKFYQHDDEDTIEEDNRLKEEQPPTIPQPLSQQQHKAHTPEEDYYEDSYESREQQHRGASSVRRNQQHRTTAAAINEVATSTLPTYQQPNMGIPASALPSFPLPLSDAWHSTTTSSSTLAPIATTDAARTTTSTTAAAATEAVLPPAPTATATGESTNAPATAAAAVAAAAPTTMRAAGNKQGKQINISRRKLLPHEQLRNYIEDAYIRMPLAVIVDPSAASLEKTKALWRDALRTNLNIKIVLVSLNASGVPAAYNFNNTRQFLAGLSGIKEHDGGDAFIGILHASELVPYDSAVFISTAAIPPHTELVQDAAITLLKKRIRLYLIWYGERTISENETQEAVGGILGEVAIRSGGEILHIVGSENSQELEGSTLTLVADAFRGSQEVEIPVDTTLSSLHVKIDAPMRMATLETPHGG